MDEGPSADTIYLDEIHLFPQSCPSSSGSNLYLLLSRTAAAVHISLADIETVDPCASMPCGEAECANVGGRAVCSYPDADIHCQFETNENGCLSVLEYTGKMDREDDADWTINSGPTLTTGTGAITHILLEFDQFS